MANGMVGSNGDYMQHKFTGNGLAPNMDDETYSAYMRPKIYHT
jgi:hypothetical protein